MLIDKKLENYKKISEFLWKFKSFYMQLNEHPSNYVAINVAINARIDQKLKNYKKTPLNFL